MASILIAYFTTDGHTLKICHTLQHCLQQKGHESTLIDIASTDVVSDKFDAYVVGASIRYGRHDPSVYQFIHHNQQLLSERGCFSRLILWRAKVVKIPHTVIRT